MEQYDDIGAKLFGGALLVILGTALCILTPFWIADALGYEAEVVRFEGWLQAQNCRGFQTGAGNTV